MPNPEQLSAFVDWFNRCITGDEKGQAQIFLDRLFKVSESVFDTFSWPQFEMGSATVPVAESGVAPDSRSTKIASEKNQTNEVFGATPALPKTTLAKIKAVAEAGREVRRLRTEVLTRMKGGLRALYRTLELPGANPLKDARAALDAAVLTAYGFSSKRDLLSQLLTLNQQVAERIERGEHVTAPGIPKKPSRSEEIGDGRLCETVLKGESRSSL